MWSASSRKVFAGRTHFPAAVSKWRCDALELVMNVARIRDSNQRMVARSVPEPRRTNFVRYGNSRRESVRRRF